MAEWTGLEPATPGVTGRYSNQLNYHSARACCPTRRLWWVLRGSNSRPTPCKGAALPTELSTLRAPNLLTVRRVQGHRNKSVYCILQCLASPELRNPRGLDLDRLIGAWVAAKPTSVTELPFFRDVRMPPTIASSARPAAAFEISA